HGGFYRHFASRDDLVAEAVAYALEQGNQRFLSAAARGGQQAFTAIVDGYLSIAHRDAPQDGCAVAALPQDVSRSDDRTRAAYGRQVENYLNILTDLASGDDPAAERRHAFLVLSALVGAIAMARAVGDRELSAEILAETAAALKEL
ncbi:TetR/AcrR family transcriptional regulator, partial [Streptomyces sp. NPDC059627]